MSSRKSPSKSVSQPATKSAGRSGSATPVKTSRTKKPKGLGRGLDALLGADALAIGDLATGDNTPAPPTVMAIDSLVPGRFQPRGRMDESGLQELADSISSQGIMQPILIRALNDRDGRYEIIAGERRYRAAKLAGLDTVPVLLREVSDENAAIMALIENIQREDLNPLEEARGVQRLLDEFNFTHEQAAQAIGRSRPATSNLLRLLNLTDPVQTMLLAGDIDMGHARALLAVPAARQIMLANEIVNRRLSVREAEKLVSRSADDVQPRSQQSGTQRVDADARRLEQSLSDLLGTRVSLKVGKRNRGQLLIDFHDWDHLNALLTRQGLAEALDG